MTRTPSRMTSQWADFTPELLLGIVPPLKASAVIALLTLSPISAVETSAADDEFPIMGQSLGGHWRNSPNVDGSLNGTLPPGRPVVIVGKSDQTHKGYNWFLIEIARELGYQWGGILCSNDRIVDGLSGECDPANVKQVGAGANGLASIEGQYTGGRGDITGGDQDRCDGWHPMVDPTYLDIDASLNTLSTYNYECSIETTEPLGTGLRIKGQCALNSVGKGQIPELLDSDRELDVLAFYKDNGNTLLLVDQSGPDRGHISSFALCNR